MTIAGTGERRDFCELQIRTSGGHLRHIRLDSQTKSDKAGQVTDLRTTLSDITELKRLENRLRVAASVVQATSEVVIITDVRGQVTAVNPAFERLTGLTEKEAVNRPIHELTDPSSSTLLQSVWTDLQRQRHWTGELRLRCEDGHHAPFLAAFSTVEENDGVIVRVAGIFTDMTSHKAAQERLYRQANYDTITDLPNRSLFTERLGHTARQSHRNNSSMALLFLDLDRFKQVNDTLGHHVGDELLAQVAERLESCIRENDTLARIGGDEFALILADVSGGQNAATVAEKTIAKLSEPFEVEGGEVRTGASIGIALYPQNAEDLDRLRRYADIAMYEAKQTGRDTYRFFSQSMTDAAMAHRHMETELRQALEAGEFRVLYQPIYMLGSGRLLGVEALVRWKHPARGLLAPDSFLAVAEDTGLIRDLGDWVVETACRDACAWRDSTGAADTMSICINVSGHQLNTPLAYQRFQQSIDRCSHARVSLILEVTESVAMDIPRNTGAHHLDRFNQLGIRLAMDDFGKGNSSLGTLNELPFDIIKIDKRFIQDLAAERPAPLVDAIVAMTHGLGLLVVAEGVETLEQLRILEAKGCDAAQGHYLSQPLDAQSLEALLASIEDNPIHDLTRSRGG